MPWDWHWHWAYQLLLGESFLFFLEVFSRASLRLCGEEFRVILRQLVGDRLLHALIFPTRCLHGLQDVRGLEDGLPLRLANLQRRGQHMFHENFAAQGQR